MWVISHVPKDIIAKISRVELAIYIYIYIYHMHSLSIVWSYTSTCQWHNDWH